MITAADPVPIATKQPTVHDVLNEARNFEGEVTLADLETAFDASGFDLL